MVFLNKLTNNILRIKTFKNWYLFVFPLNKVFNTKRVAVLWNGLRFNLRDDPSTDFGIVMEVVGQNVYKIENIKDPKVVVDAGANIGVFSVLLAKKFPTAKIYAIEPERGNYQCLLENIKINNIENIIPKNQAVSNDFGTVTFYLSEHQAAHSLKPRTSDNGSVLVETIPLSSLGKMDALKIDIEGSEYDVEIPDCQYLAVELHRDERRETVLEMLKRRYADNFSYNPITSIFIGRR